MVRLSFMLLCLTSLTYSCRNREVWGAAHIYRERKFFLFFFSEGPGGDVGQLIKAIDTLYVFLPLLDAILEKSLQKISMCFAGSRGHAIRGHSKNTPLCKARFLIRPAGIAEKKEAGSWTHKAPFRFFKEPEPTGTAEMSIGDSRCTTGAGRFNFILVKHLTLYVRFL